MSDYNNSMAPEIAGLYVVGTIPAGAFSVFHYLRRKARSQSKSARQLQINLRQIGLYWVDTDGEIATYRPDFEKSQQLLLRKTFLIAGAATMATSWLGLLFHALIFLSYEKFAVTRLEKRIFNSDLVRKTLDAKQVEALLMEIKSL